MDNHPRLKMLAGIHFCKGFHSITLPLIKILDTNDFSDLVIKNALYRDSANTRDVDQATKNVLKWYVGTCI